ncbi:MAG: hypothetical protein AB7N91_25820 [Candidatus Tectimicrobiota bacterium]
MERPGRPLGMREGSGRRALRVLTEEDWALLASLAEGTHLNKISMRDAQRCFDLYKAGYLYTDAKGWVSLSLHGKRELAKRLRALQSPRE